MPEKPLLCLGEAWLELTADTPPELAADISDTGIMLSGGGAMLAGLPLLISRITGIRTVVAKSPIDSVVTGIGRIIESEGIAANARFRSR